jgi:tetratricopeptide (TPR) repeat protein
VSTERCRVVPTFLVGLLTTCWLGTASADQTLDQGRNLLEQGKPAAAFSLLEPLEQQRAGDPEFDFLLGLAALEAGERTRAVFAFERVLAIQPNHARARAELARAYLSLGENRAAREEFERVRQQPIPDGVATTIDRLLAIIESAEKRDSPSLSGFVELSGGSDSNVNSATDSTTVAVPALGLATLNPNSVQTGDLFTSLAGALSYRHPVGGGHSLTGDVKAVARINRDKSQFDTTSLDGSLGWKLARGADAYSAALTASTFERDGADLRDTIGLSVQWQHDLDALRQGTLFGQYNAIGYPGQSIRDVDRYVLGAGYAQAVGQRTVAFGSLYGGAEAEKARNVKHLGHTLGGLRAGVSNRLTEVWTLLANFGFETRRHGGDEPLFNRKRSDDQLEFGLGANWKVAKHWTAGARAVYLDNSSNIPVFDYDRELFTLSLRADF